VIYERGEKLIQLEKVFEKVRKCRRLKKQSLGGVELMHYNLYYEVVWGVSDANYRLPSAWRFRGCVIYAPGDFKSREQTERTVMTCMPGVVSHIHDHPLTFPIGMLRIQRT
jgi:hypothetical protein